MVAPSIEGTLSVSPSGASRRYRPASPGCDGHDHLYEGIPEFQRGLERQRGQVLLGVLCCPVHAHRQRVPETSEYLIVNDQIGGKGINYDLSNTTAKSPVSIDGGCIRFALPQPFEKELSITVEFGGAKLKATGKDLFTDYWEKVS